MKNAAFIAGQEQRSAERSVRNWLCSTSFVVLAAAMPIGAVQAQEWTGGVSTDWDHAGNWQGGAAPLPNGNVEINNEGAGWPVINGGTRSVNKISIGTTADGGQLTITGGGVLNNANGVDIGVNYSGSATVTGSGSIWNIAEFLELGFVGTGALTVSNNGRVNSKDGYLGNRQQSTGTATVSGGGRWINSNELFVGYQGTGTLNVATGGLVAANITTLGMFGPGVGTITVDGASSLLTTGGLVVGRAGRGVITVTNGGALESASGILGELAGSSGTVNLQDALWYSDTNITVGAAGTGSLVASGGSEILSGAVTVGRNVGGNGTVMLTGSDTFWSASGDFTVGRDGAGNMTLGTGAKVNSHRVSIGQNAGSNGSLTVTSGAEWKSSGEVAVGEAGTGHMSIGSLGHVVSVGGKIGSGEGSVGTVEIIGAPHPSDRSLWNAGDGTVTVGGAGGQGTLSVRDDGAVISDYLVVGASDLNGSTGSATVNVTNGGRVIVDFNASIGEAAGSRGTALVTGQDSFLNASAGLLTVGGAGQGDLRIEDRGFVLVRSARVGGAAGGVGNVMISGDGSLLRAMNVFRVGDGGQGSVTVENNGDLLTVGGRIGQSAGSSGTVSVTGSGSQWNAKGDYLAVGDNGGASLSLTDQARLLADGILIGTAGTSAALSVDGGARVESGAVTIGYAADHVGSANLAGANSVWNLTGNLTVGGVDDGALTISDNAEMTVSDISRTIVGDSAAATGTLTLTNSARLDASTGNRIWVGNNGTGSLTVQDGAELRSNGAMLGVVGGSTGNVTVSGPNARWVSGSNTFVVGSGGTGSLTVQNGASVSGDTHMFVGEVEGGVGAVAVAGPTSRIDVLSAAIGSAGNGSLTISGGASFNTDEGGAIGGAGAASATGTGNVLITGAGSAWNIGDSAYRLLVGQYGAGTLRVENGGAVNGEVGVLALGTLSGNGTVGNTTIHHGGTLIGVQGQTLTTANLNLESTANVNVSLGSPGNAAGLFKVIGNLTLDGTLNVTNAGGFGQGVYRIIDYTGTLWDNGLDVGAMPSGATGTVQTAVANQVNLLVSGFANDTQFWNGTTTTADGVIHGGNGTWRAGPTNWTDVNGTTASAWGNQFAVFQNTPGVIVVDDSAGGITTTGMQFIGQDWFVTGDPITLAGAGGNTTVRVGDGSIGGVAHFATIESDMTGNTRLVKADLGTLILTGANTYTGGTTIAAGTLQIGNGSTAGSIVGDILNNGALAFNHSGTKTFADNISGSGSLSVQAGQLILTGANSYTGGTTIAAGGRLRIGDGLSSGAIVGNVVANGDLRFNNLGATSFGGAITGSGQITLATGDLTLSGNSSGFTGFTQLQGGVLRLNGALGGVGVAVTNGATLSGNGSTTAAVDVQNTGILAGMQGQTLTTGAMTLASGANVNVALGAPGGAGLFQVNGDLTLDGTVNVTDAGGFGAGVYRVFDYTGSLTDNGLNIGTTPAGFAGTVQTAVAKQVNLLVGVLASDVQFWNGTTTTADGVIHGGSGVWTAGPTTNWTDVNGTTAGAWGSKFAVFQNNPDVVTVDGAAGVVTTTGMQFIGDGWRVTGDTLRLADPSATTVIRVGDGSAASANHKVTIESNLTGPSKLWKDDLGTLILTGASTYSSGTVINAGALHLGDGGASGSIAGDVLNRGVFAFNRSDTYSFGGVLSGTGVLRQIGAGTTILTANSTGYAGSTVVEAGTLAVNGRLGGSVNVQSGGTLTGSGMLLGAVSVADGGTLAGVQGQTLMTGDLTLASGANVDVRLGAPSNASLFRVAGDLILDGTLNVTDAGGFGQGVYRIFSYSGALTDNGLDVGLMPTGTSGSVQTSIANEVNLLVSGTIGDIMFWNGSTTVADGTIHGGAGTWMAGPTNWTNENGSVAGAWNDKFAVFQTNPDVVTVDGLAGAISMTGMQFIGEGWTVTGDAITLNGADGSTTIRVGDGSAAGASHSATIGSELTGASRLVKNDLGTLILTGANSYTGGTTIAAGTLQIGDVGTTGSITGDVLNNGLLRFSRTDATTFGGLISGSGAVHVAHGQLTLTGDNSYAGPTTIGSVASLTLGDGGTSGSIAGDVAVNGQLRFNRSNDFSYAGVISGFGSIRQIGSGKTELTGNSSGFTGTTFVDAGTLAVNGSLGGTLDVLAGGRLQGIGTVGNTIVRGTIAPGNSIGTLNVAGNISFLAGSIYEVEVNAAGQSDKILASGSAAINGGTVQVLAGAGLYKPQTDYTILTATGGVTGAFTGVTSNLAFLDPTLKYDASNVYLTLRRNDISFSDVGGTPNQVAAGEGTETLGWDNPIFDAVVNLSADQAKDAFDQLSGEIHPSARTAMIEDSRLVRHAVWERLRSSAGEEGRGVWGHAIGSWGHTSGDGNAARLDRKAAGLLMGLDASAGENVRLGAVWGYSQTDIDVDARASSGEIDSFHVGIYAGGQWGKLGVRAGAAYAMQDIHTVRSISFPGFSDTVRAGYNGETAQAFGEVGYGFNLGRTQLEPFASVAYVRARSNEFAETGGPAKLNGGRATTDVTFTTLGLRSTTNFNLGEADATLKLGAGWRHAFGDNVPVTRMRYQAGGDAFSIMGVPVRRDSATIDAGLDVAVSGYTSIGLSYQGQIGDGLADHTAKASIRFRF